MIIITCSDCDKTLAEIEGEWDVYGDVSFHCKECLSKVTDGCTTQEKGSST